MVVILAGWSQLSFQKTAVLKCITEDAWYTLKDLTCIFGISMAAVHGILTKHLKLSTVCAEWILYLLTDAQKAVRFPAAQTLLKKNPKLAATNIINFLSFWQAKSSGACFEPQHCADNKQWFEKGQPRQQLLSSFIWTFASVRQVGGLVGLLSSITSLCMLIVSAGNQFQ